MPDRLLDREYLSTSDVVDQFGITAQTVHRWIRDGNVKAIKFKGATGYRIDVESLEQYLKSRAVVSSAKRELQS